MFTIIVVNHIFSHGDHYMASAQARKEARDRLRRAGLTVRSWASTHGVHENTVHEVLSGRQKGSYGSAHKVAVLLGLKDGDINVDSLGNL
jgi:gp16 family phage-associated protein